VILICYEPGPSTEMIGQSVGRWAEEVATNCPKAPIVAVGIIGPNVDAQVRSSTDMNKEPDRRIRAVAEQSGGRVVGHILCNVLSGEGVDDVFEIVRLLSTLVPRPRPSTGFKLIFGQATRAAIVYGHRGSVRPPIATRRKSTFAGLFSGLRRIREEDGDDK